MPSRRQILLAVSLLFSGLACGGGGDGGGGTGTDSDFHPTTNTNLSGSVSYKSVNIPAGVTVTGSSDLSLTVTGDVVIAGTLTAPCHSLTITASGALTVNGTVNNACTDANPNAPQLAMIGKSGYHFEGATIHSSGNIVIVDGPNLNPPVTLSDAAVRAPGKPASAAPYRCQLVNTTFNVDDPATSNPIVPGANGPDGSMFLDGCGQLRSGETGGNLRIDGVTVNGANGHGGYDDVAGNSVAHGGNGGYAGQIVFVSDDDIDLLGENHFNGGSGGPGGDAVARNSTAGGAAVATGGKGGGIQKPGGPPPVEIVSNQGSITVSGKLVIKLGKGGEGGDASATGGKGGASSKGGNATATGGDGGDGSPAIQNAHGAVVVTGSIEPTGGAGGKGGDATTNPGDGGDGVITGSPGGDGGDAGYHGGKGGKGLNGATPVIAADGSRVFIAQNAPGGDGGKIHDSGGNGGAGGPCPTPPPASGKGPKGGNGGATNGAAGLGGLGSTNGTAGSGDISGAANGGNGGGGNPGGDGGNGGPDGSTPPGAPSGNPEHTSGNPYNVTGSYGSGQTGPTCPALSVTGSPATQTVVQGGTGSVQGNLVRTNLPGVLDWVVKNPSGTVIASGTVAAGATSFSAQFPIAAGTAIGLGTYSLSVSTAGGPSASAPFTVNVIAAGAGVQIVWTNCNTDTPIVYASWYDGASGAALWNQLPINTSVPGQQSVSFTATQPAVQFVVVTRKPDGSAVTTTFLNLLATQLKPESDASCSGSTTGATTVQGTITLNAGQATFIGTAGGSTSFVGPAVTYSIPNVLNGSHTFIGARQPSNSLFDFAQVFRNVTVPGPGPTFDFTTNAIQLMSGTVAATNTTNSWRSQTNMVTPDGASGIVSRTAFNTTATKNQFWMPGTALQNGEYNQTIDFTSGSADFEQITGYWFGDVPAGRTIPFPNPIDFNYTQVSANGTNPVIFSATGTVPSNLNQLIAMSLTQTVGGIARTINLYESDAFNNNLSSFNITMAPYAATWIPPEYGLQTGALVNFALEHFGSSVANGVFMPPTSNRTITVAAKFKTTTPN